MTVGGLSFVVVFFYWDFDGACQPMSITHAPLVLTRALVVRLVRKLGVIFKS